MPGSYALQIYRGDSQHWQFKLWSDADKTAPVDLTGATAEAEIRDRPGGAVIALICGITAPNIIDVDLPAATSHMLPLKALQWDLQLTFSGGVVKTVVAGAATVTADITDSTP